MKKIIKVSNPAKLPTISWKDLKSKYQPNSLKEKKNRDVGGLKQSILSLGFNIPMFIWEKGKYIVDGAGRHLALEMLEYEGYEIPNIPYIPIEAKNLKEAKRQTLVISSQYGLTTRESLGEFMLDMGEIDLSFVHLEGFNLEEIDWKPPQATEIDMEKMKGETKMDHECPKCGFHFNTK